MDEFDLKLLDALQDDGRLTNNELADRIGLSASQCSRRRAAFEKSGVIESYRAVLATETLGLDVIVFIPYLYATTWLGLPVASGLAPTVLLPAAHDEPPLWLPLFDLTFRIVASRTCTPPSCSTA